VTELISRADGPSASGRVAGTDTDPAAELIQTVTPAVPRAVDELHVAAVLESMGVTDQSALDKYRHDDVFALADAVYHRLPVVTDPSAGDDAPAPSAGSARSLTHGLLYILPTLVYPAVLIALGQAAMLRGLVFATTLGWVWGMGMSAVAYQLVGHGKEQSADRAQRLLGLAGLVVGLFSAILLAATGPGGAGLVAFVVGQICFQLMSGVLVFHGRELRLALAMLPASVTGIVLLLSHYAQALVVLGLVAGGLSILILAVTAWVTSLRAASQADSPGKIPWSRVVAGTAPSVAYAALCATFLLLTDSRFLTGEVDLAIAALPLILGMGMLEWRAHRFHARLGKLWSQAAMSGEFSHSTWRLLIQELANCLAVLGALATILLLILRETGSLSARGAMLIDAHVLLGGAFFLGFILARYQQFGRLLVIMTLVVAANVLMLWWVAGLLAPDGAVPVFLLCTVVLLILQLITLRISVRRIYYYRLSAASASEGDTRHARRNPRGRTRSPPAALHDSTSQAPGTDRRGVRHPGHHPAAVEGTGLHAGYPRDRVPGPADPRFRRRRFPLGTGRRLLRRGSAAVDDRAAPQLPRPAARALPGHERRRADRP
jgi:hypothetical protein